MVNEQTSDVLKLFVEGVLFQVGPGYVVGARLEVKGDALAKK